MPMRTLSVWLLLDEVVPGGLFVNPSLRLRAAKLSGFLPYKAPPSKDKRMGGGSGQEA